MVPVRVVVCDGEPYVRIVSIEDSKTFRIRYTETYFWLVPLDEFLSIYHDGEGITYYPEQGLFCAFIEDWYPGDRLIFSENSIQHLVGFPCGHRFYWADERLSAWHRREGIDVECDCDQPVVDDEIVDTVEVDLQRLLDSGMEISNSRYVFRRCQ